jgi:hypothetical protein
VASEAVDRSEAGATPLSLYCLEKCFSVPAPGSLVFASCSIARAIQRQVAAPVRIAFGVHLIGAGRALRERSVAVAFEHENGSAPDVLFGDHGSENAVLCL